MTAPAVVPPILVTSHVLSDPADLAPPSGLDTTTYSLMKHGDLTAVRAMAGPLAERLVREVPELVEHPAVPVFPVAYKAVRPACWFLADAVLTIVTAARAERGLAPGRIVRIAKDSVTVTDYASSSATAREEEMRHIGFQLEEDVDGAQVVLIDDVRVTGLAERAALNTLAAATPLRTVLAYVAVIEGDLASDPSIEARLNHAFVESVAAMAPAARAGDFALTIRFLKRLLRAPAPERATFLATCPPPLLEAIVDGADATGADFSSRFSAELDEIRGLLAVTA
ncbi:phosphoribosyltransferase family protein [Xylanimonas protaetiae]|uniref:Phosphoribosyltransferase n=1 Tax=Xylanimonas protaetiae TaxID=2509457 RepID=A0A4P6F8R2_9MICO|nr:phosphoribosyltransferase family protein [Xylanimonas protaetiae]QAY70719.1 hypothetical protein ET471_12395 [Xylanimonas protaetiae]